MSEFPDIFIEIPLAAKILGVSPEQSMALCSVLGIEPVRRGEDLLLDRSALHILYRRLNPVFVRP